MSQIITRKSFFTLICWLFVFAIVSLYFSAQALAHSATAQHQHCKRGSEASFQSNATAGCPDGTTDVTASTDGHGDSDSDTPNQSGGDDGESDDSTIPVDDNEENDDSTIPVNPTTSTTTPIAFTNPIAFDTVDGLLGRILVTIQSIVAVLAILFIVIGAIIYITSGGNQQRTELAKNAIFAALIGLALALAAPSFLKEIYTAVGGDITNNDVNNARTLTEIALSITRFLLSLVGVLSIVMLVSGGIIYILSAGDQSRTDMAKRTIIYAIIGLVVALVSLVVVGQVVGVISGA